MNKTKKLIAGLSTAVVTAGLSGCGMTQGPFDSSTGSSTVKYNGHNDTEKEIEYQKADQTYIPSEPDNAYCDDYAWDAEEGYYECVDVDSEYYHHYYHSRGFYPTPVAIKNKKPVYVIGQKEKPKATSNTQPKSNTTTNSGATTSKKTTSSSSSTSSNNSSYSTGSSHSSSSFGSPSRSSTRGSSGFGSSSSSFGG